MYGIATDNGVVKYGLTHLAKVKLGEAVSTVTLLRPNGIAATAPTAVADVTDDVYSVAFTPNEIGPWTLTLAGATQTETRTYECRRMIPAEERLGVSQTPVTLASIHGLAVPAGKELTGTTGVVATPEWWFAAQQVSPANLVAKEGGWVILDNSRLSRVPHSGLITGIRIAASSATLDLSATNVDHFQVLVMYGTSTSAMYVRGRSEDIAKTRLIAVGGYFYIKFDRPIWAERGDQIALYLSSSSGDVTCLTHYICAPDQKASFTDGATDGTGLIVTSAATDFDALSLDTTLYYAQVHYPPSANRGHVAIASVSGHTITLGASAGANKTGVQVVVSRGSAAGILKLTGDASDTLPNSFGTVYAAALDPLYTLGRLSIIMNPPTIALAGDSIMAGLEAGQAYTGSTHELAYPDAYRVGNDMGEIIAQETGLACVNVSRGGASLDTWLTVGSAWAFWSLWAQLIQYRPAVVVYCTLTNDCIVTHTTSEIKQRLDLLYHSCLQIRARLILTTGIPIPDRSAEAIAFCKRLRSITKSWAKKKGVLCIDTLAALQPDWLTAEAIIDSTYTVNSAAFPDYHVGGNLHLTQAGTQSLGKATADGLRGMSGTGAILVVN